MTQPPENATPEALHSQLLEKERRGQPRVVQEALDRDAAKVLEKQLTALRATIFCLVIYTLLFSTCTIASSKKNTPIWPGNGQREFYGEQMFIENDKGKWRAWIFSARNAKNQEAMNFFSGKRESVQLIYDKNKYSIIEFIDTHGKRHLKWSGSYVFDIGDISHNDGAKYFGDQSHFIYFNSDTLFMDAYSGACPLELSVISQVGDQAAMPDKIVMYYEPPDDDCPKGSWRSSIGTAIDLTDGTMLVAMERYILRLRMSDLSTVGRAPNMYVLDAAKIKSIVSNADNTKIKDPHQYLSDALRITPKNIFNSNEKLK
jgi:hypothetical protein